MKLAVVCFALSVLAAIRVITQGLWNRAHTADGFFGDPPLDQYLLLVIVVAAALAGLDLVRRARRRS